MSSKDNCYPLRIYLNHLLQQKKRFPCPHCAISILPKEFEKHCSNEHTIDSKTRCVWCLGSETWPRGKRNQNARHMLKCFKKFSPKAPVPRNVLSKLLDMSPLCPARDFFGHTRLELPDPAFGFFQLLETDSFSLFQNPELNLAASYLRYYLETADTHDWLHVMIKAEALSTFTHALNNAHTLRFSCWCDGGSYKEARHRQHRHLIVVSPNKGRFLREVWSKVSVPRENRPKRHYPCKGYKTIHTPLHLIHTFGYLSKRESSCHFSFRKKSPIKTQNHFFIFTPLPIDYKLPLSLLWEGGILQLLYQEKFQNVSIARLIETPLIQINSQWRQEIKHFYKLDRGLVIPVKRSLLPTQDEQPYVLHGARKLYFCETDEQLTEEEWLQKHVQGGNCFYEAVENEYWVPRKRDQESLNAITPIAERLRAETKSQESEMNHLKQKLERAQEENKSQESEMNHLKQEINHLKQKLERAQEEKKSQESEINHLKQKLEEVTKIVYYFTHSHVNITAS